MSRVDLMAAAVSAFGGKPHLVAKAINCDRSMVSQILLGKKRLSDALARDLITALEDRAERFDRLALSIAQELEANPQPHWTGRWSEARA